MIPAIMSIGKDASFTLKNGNIVSGRVLDADCAGKWCSLLTGYGYRKIIKGADIKKAEVV